MIVAEADAGRYSRPSPANALAFAIVRLGEAFLYNDAIVGIRGDTDRLREIEAALFGRCELATDSRRRPAPSDPAPRHRSRFRAGPVAAFRGTE